MMRRVELLSYGGGRQTVGLPVPDRLRAEG